MAADFLDGDQMPSVALIGANGMLASMVKKKAPPNYALHLFDLPQFDMTNQVQVMETISNLAPDIIINCAAYTNVDGAESEQNLAHLVNGKAVSYLAKAAQENESLLIHISTDYVFDGQKIGPYQETDVTKPKSVYGRSKLAGESAILENALKEYFILRTSWLYGPNGKNFVETILRLAAEREELKVIDDQIGSPTYTGDLADAIFNLLEASFADQTNQQLFGIYHFANSGQCSWYEFACEIISMAKVYGLPLKVKKIMPISTAEYPLPAKRPANSVFDKAKYKNATGADIPDWRESLNTYFSLRGEALKE